MSTSDKLKKLLGTVAPALATAYGGPFGGIAAQYIKDKLGVPEADTPREQLELLEKRPDLLLQLKQIDKDFEKHMASVGVDIFKTEVDDRKSARELAKVNMVPQIMLTIMFIVGYFWLLFVFLTADTSGISEWQKGIVGTLLGILTAAIPQILAFWFGSSHGSQKKDATLVK